MKKWTAMLLILCIGISMVVISGCEKKQMEEQQTETLSAPVDTAAVAADSTAIMSTDSVTVEMEEIVE